MVENDILRCAKDYLEKKQYQKLRNYIWSNHTFCQTDSVKVQLLHIWEDSLYQEFIDNRSPNITTSSQQTDVKTVLSSSMRYKLRKKHPCPIELEQELRVKNARLPKLVHDGLNNWLKKHISNPFPNKVEKEGLAVKLGITPQQVNRWFIQRRKMLRLRGDIYLGRQYEPRKGKENCRASSDNGEDYDDDNMDDDEGEDSLSRHSDDSTMTCASRSLLEKILTQPNDSESSNVSQQITRCNGSNAEVMHTKLALLAADQCMLPTPPPSVSGERSTPPEDLSASAFEQALDLSVVRPMTLAPNSPAWRFDQQDSDFSYSTSNTKYRNGICNNTFFNDLDDEERIAVNALLSLARYH